MNPKFSWSKSLCAKFFLINELGLGTKIPNNSQIGSCIWEKPLPVTLTGVVQNFTDELHESIRNIGIKYPKSKLILCGDFNINFLTRSHSLTSLLDMLESRALFPTMKNGSRGKNCLDKICVTLESIMYETD